MGKVGSYEKINYSLRPAKNIERKMICEALLRLSVLENIKKYQYVGFGSAYFVDFILFHKYLGITSLTSIENSDEKKRFSFNKPFNCVELLHGESNELLPTIDWKNKPSILWLDYDKPLNSSMLEDIRTFLVSAEVGSVFMITVNVQPDKKPNEVKTSQKEYRQQQLRNRVDKNRVPKKYENSVLGNEDNPRAIYEIIDQEIHNILSNRNGVLASNKKICFKQIFNFLYRDSSLMLTTGGIIYEKGQEQKIKEMAFENLEFVMQESSFFSINVPNLTYREIRALDTLLPKHNIEEITEEIPLKIKDIRDYSLIYRYFPAFAEASL